MSEIVCECGHPASKHSPVASGCCGIVTKTHGSFSWCSCKKTGEQAQSNLKVDKCEKVANIIFDCYLLEHYKEGRSAVVREIAALVRRIVGENLNEPTDECDTCNHTRDKHCAKGCLDNSYGLCACNQFYEWKWVRPDER